MKRALCIITIIIPGMLYAAANPWEPGVRVAPGHGMKLKDLAAKRAALKLDSELKQALQNMVNLHPDMPLADKITFANSYIITQLERLSPDMEQKVLHDFQQLYAWKRRSPGPILQHLCCVTSAQWSSDGTRIVTTSNDQTARVWDAKTGAQICDPLQHNQNAYSAQFSPDGTRISTMAGGTVNIWDAETGGLIHTLQFTDHLFSNQWSADSTRILTQSGGTADIWDAETGGLISTLQGLCARPQWSPDGTRIVAIGQNYTVRIYDINTGQQIGNSLQHNTKVNSAQFNHNGTQIVTLTGGAVNIWDAETGARIQMVPIPGHLFSEQLSPDYTRIVTVSADHTARIWDAQTGDQIGNPLQHNGRVSSTRFSPNGARIVIALYDHTAYIWDTETGEQIGNPLQHNDTVSSPQFSPDGTRILTISNDNAVHIWDVISSINEILKYIAQNITPQ